MATVVGGRLVPGAPPPLPLTKTQKKKRRAAVKKDGGESEPDTPATNSVVLPDTQAAALTDKAPEEKDVKDGAVAEELVAKPEAPKSEADDSTGAGGSKSSPVVELLNKRLKAIGKKITRIHMYSSKPTSELNDDQKKTLATLPSLEAVRKELEETRKAVETLEAEQVKETAHARAAAEEAERQRITNAVAEAQKTHAERTAQILDFIRFHSLLSNADPSVQSLNLVEAEINAVYASVNALLAQEAESKHAILNGFLRREGEVEGVSFERLLDILEEHQRPTAQEEVAEQIAEAVVGAPAEAEAEIADQETVDSGIPTVVPGVPSASGGMSFRFMQESELEGDAVSFESGAEWVEKKEEAPQESADANINVSIEVKGTYTVGDSAEYHPPEQADNGALNWADDEGELPSIDGLHATFGTSGSGTSANGPTPVEQQSAPVKGPAQASGDAAPNGKAQPAAAEDDGFTQARGGRARGRGRGFRGGERGGFRGGERGGYRGGRGERGGRGRPQQGSESGNWRNPPEGEQRGRGRGRGRGGFDRSDRGDRGGRGGPGPRGGRGGANGE